MLHSLKKESKMLSKLPLKNIIFMGMKHCGKSTFGKRVAEQWDVPFYDTDDELETYYLETYGISLSTRDIYIKEGEKRFKEIEITVLDKIASKLDATKIPSVISLGGGLPVNDLILMNSPIKQLGIAVFIDAPPEVLYKRVMASGRVPFIDQNNPKEHFFELYNKRLGYYCLHSDICVHVADTSIEENLKTVIDKIEDYIHGR
jgi:shikimate kinase